MERDDFQILERDLCHIPPGQKSKTIAATDILGTFSIPDILTSSVPACCSAPSPQSFAQQGVEPDALGSEGRLHYALPGARLTLPLVRDHSRH